MGSETGVLDIPPGDIVAKGRLEPGKMFLVDLEAGRIVDDERLKHEIASAEPYRRWLDEFMVPLADLPGPPRSPGPDHDTLLHRQQAFGYTLEDMKYILGPMGNAGEEAIGSMGTDTPLAVALGPVAAAVQLLPAVVRPGDQPAARRDPGGAGDLGPHRGRGARGTS